MATKPTILFVPGAWHLPESYDLVAEPLRAAGYACVYVTLPSNGGPAAVTSFDPDVAAIRAKLAPLVESGADVVVVAHSYGSMPANEAISGLAKADRVAQGKAGGVGHYVFCTAFLTAAGVSLMDVLQHKDLPWFAVSPDKMIVTPNDPRDVFYADLDDVAAAGHVAKLTTFSYQTYFSKTVYPAWMHVPTTYIFCTADKAIPYPVQQMLVQGAEAAGVQINKVTLEGASHSPMLSQPGLVMSAIKAAADSV